MTKRERFLAFANFEPVDRLPRRASWVEAQEKQLTEALGCPPDQYFDMDVGEGAGLVPPDDFVPPDYSIYHPDRVDGKDGFTIDAAGCGHLNAGFYHFTEYISPLRNAESFAEIENYPIASNEGWSNREMVAAKGRADEAQTYTMIFAGHMYERAWQVRGYEPFLMDLVGDREWAELLLDRFCENNLRVAVAAARADYDCLATGDDVANQETMMFQPDLWREVMKPRWAKVMAAARAIKPDIHIWYHSDGNLTAILDDLVEIGVTILNPVQPECMDPVAIRKRFGKRLAFDGCVGTQTTFPFGTVGDMHERIRELAGSLEAGKGGLMVSPTHVLEPDVPVANVKAFFDACDGITL